jgi:sec-independent protein translocase protein TatC
MVSFWALGTGLLFELPVVIYFLSKVGIVTPELLRTYRKYALIVVLTIGAFLTPPDPISQVIVAVPLLLLYEGSVYISAFVNRRRRKELGMTTE